MSSLFWQDWQIWVAVGLVLALAELIVPSIYLLWFGIAAIVTGLSVGFVSDAELDMQFVRFAILAILSVGLGVYLTRRQRDVSISTNIGTIDDGHIGKTVIVTDAIVNGEGWAKLGDSLIRVHGPDLPKGSRVRLAAMDGTAFKVENIEE